MTCEKLVGGLSLRIFGLPFSSFLSFPYFYGKLLYIQRGGGNGLSRGVVTLVHDHPHDGVFHECEGEEDEAKRKRQRYACIELE